MQPNQFTIGQWVSFEYNNKLREGTVEAVKPTVLVVKLDMDDDGKTYKAFSYSKMRGMTPVN